MWQLLLDIKVLAVVIRISENTELKFPTLRMGWRLTINHLVFSISNRGMHVHVIRYVTIVKTNFPEITSIS